VVIGSPCVPPVQQTIFNRDDMVFIVLTDSRLLTKRIEKPSLLGKS